MLELVGKVFLVIEAGFARDANEYPVAVARTIGLKGSCSGIGVGYAYLTGYAPEDIGGLILKIFHTQPVQSRDYIVKPCFVSATAR